MLVLSRHRDESIIIGNNIVVTIVDIRGDKVRLGIEAPTEIPVHRQEVFEAIQRENLRAGHGGADDVRSLADRNRVKSGSDLAWLSRGCAFLTCRKRFDTSIRPLGVRVSSRNPFQGNVFRQYGGGKKNVKDWEKSLHIA